MTNPQDLKSHISEVFSRASSSYDRTGGTLFSHFGRKLVEFASIQAGARVLDVACGSGAVLIPASRAAAAGQVIGVDMSEGMLERARTEVHRLGLSNVTVVKMDAENLECADRSFDFVLCGMALFFLPDLDKALAGFYRVLRQNGCLVASTQRWPQDPTTTRWQELKDSYKHCLTPAPARPKTEMSSEAEIRETLSRAGFVDIEVAEEEATCYLRDEEVWWQAEWSGFRRDFLERLDPKIVEDYKRRAFELLREEKTEKGIPRTWHLLFSKALKSS